MNNLEESTKIGKQTRFAVLTRALADAALAGRAASPEIIAELGIMRRQEQQVADREVGFAGIGRQIGDAESVGKDVTDLIARAALLRSSELG